MQLYQKSDKRNDTLQINYNNTTVNHNTIKFHYTEGDYNYYIAIRAYINSVLSKYFLISRV